MGVKLRIEMARGVVTEGPRHHLLPAGADHRAGVPILHPGFYGVLFDPGKRARHGRIVGHDRPLVAPTSARSETDFGADKVTSRPGR